MSDLEKRLRRIPANLDYDLAEEPHGMLHIGEDAHRAADEIERLRKQLEKAQNLLRPFSDCVFNDIERQIIHLAERNAELLMALEEIARKKKLDAVAACSMRAIARTALSSALNKNT